MIDIEGVTLKPPEGEEFKDAASMYLRAFNVPHTSWAEDLTQFWISLAEHGVGHFVVAKRTTVVGMAAVFPYQSCAWIGHMAVEPDLQRKGIGTLLMDELLHILEREKIGTVKLDATDIGRPLYTKYNFREECKVLQYEMHGSDTANFEGVCIIKDIPEWCLSLDRRAFGGDRSLLLKTILDMGGKMIVLDDVGYGVLWKERVGPVVAENVETAVTICNYAYTMGARLIDVPLHPVSEEFLSQLKGQGVKFATPATRMVRGDSIGNPTNVFGSFSSAMG